MPVGTDTQALEPALKSHRGTLTGIAGQHHTAHIQSILTESVDQAHDLKIVGDTQIAAALVLLNVVGVDCDDDFRLFLELDQHTHLAVWQEAGQHTGSMEIIEQLAAEFKVQLAAEIVHTFFDPGGLQRQIFFIVKSNSFHIDLQDLR